MIVITVITAVVAIQSMCARNNGTQSQGWSSKITKV